MTLKVTIQPTVQDDEDDPVYYALNNGVEVGASGELLLVSDRRAGKPIEFRIYGPGTWREINVELVDD